MKISVIVSTYNSPEWLEKVLTGYVCQDDADFEILVADDGSGRETKKLIERLARDTAVPLNHVWHEDRGFRKCTILNKAIEAAQGDYLVFTDGDCVPRADFVAGHRRHAEAGRFLSGGYCRLPMSTSLAIHPDDIRSGRAFDIAWLAAHGYRPSPKWLKILARPWRLDGLFNTLTRARPTFNGNNSSCFRADALAVGGFDERMGYGGEDREFGYRLENAGIRPKLIRYSALCLHLDHKRGYKDAQIRTRNESIIAETRSTRRIRTDHGLQPVD
jgi:glycosyltransferase involved in cell wall biosynthesis